MIDGKTPQAATFKLLLEQAESDQGWDYLCFRIARLTRDKVISPDQSDACNRYIDRMLSPYNNYATWLHANHRDLYDRESAEPNGHLAVRREGRIAWLRHIISVLES